MAMFSNNTSQYEGTGFTPHELVFGTLARQPAGDIRIEEQSNRTYAEYLRELFTKIQGLQEVAANPLKTAKERSKMYYDWKLNPQNLRIEDKSLCLKN